MYRAKSTTNFHIINLPEFKNWLPLIPLLPRGDDGRCEKHSGVLRAAYCVTFVW